MLKLKRVSTSLPQESEIYQKAVQIARCHNIKIYKGSRDPHLDFFKIFFFIKSKPAPKNSQNGHASDAPMAKEFNRPDEPGRSRPDSEYMIIRVFPKKNQVQVEDSNVKQSLEMRIGEVADVCDQGKVMTLETQMKSLVAHWLELSGQNSEHRRSDKLF